MRYGNMFAEEVNKILSTLYSRALGNFCIDLAAYYLFVFYFFSLAASRSSGKHMSKKYTCCLKWFLCFLLKWCGQAEWSLGWNK
jgi:hypothetical protein